MKKFSVYFTCLILLITCSSAFMLAGCTKQKNALTNKTALDENKTPNNICVFIPGVLQGSPTYEMLAQGVTRAVDDFKKLNNEKNAELQIDVSVVEGGFNQAEWESKITSLAAGGKYDVIISTNPSIPDIVKIVNQKFPSQKFILFDGYLNGIPNVYTMSYNTKEEAFLAGYFAALQTQSFADGKNVIGLLAAQEYPVMNEIILPFFEKGAQAVDASFSVDFRVLGNWFDAEKASSIAQAMFRGDCKIILTIAGGANEGVLDAAARTKNKVIWFDSNGNNIRPDVIAGSAIIEGEKAAYDILSQYLNGTLQLGSSSSVGLKENYIDFIAADNEPDIYKTSMLKIKAQIRNGELLL